MMHFNRSSGYYKKMAELQDKLKRSEEERLKLEEKFSIIMKTCREEEEKKIVLFRQVYENFLEDDKKRQDRNERILQILDRIEAQAASLSAKSERLRLLRKHYEAYLLHLYPLWKKNGKFETNLYMPAYPQYVTNSFGSVPIWQQAANHVDANLLGSSPRSPFNAESNISRFTTQAVVKSEPLPAEKSLEINEDKRIDNYINVAAKLLNVPKGELQEYEKYDEEKSVHTEQDTSRDLLNISLSDDGILEEKKKEHMPKLAATKVEDKACRIIVKEVKEVPDSEDLKASTLPSGPSRNGSLLTPRDLPGTPRTGGGLESIPCAHSEIRYGEEYRDGGTKLNEYTIEHLGDDSQLLTGVLNEERAQNQTTSSTKDGIIDNLEIRSEDREQELHADRVNEENEHCKSDNNQCTDPVIHPKIECPDSHTRELCINDNYLRDYNEEEEMKENVAGSESNYPLHNQPKQYKECNYQEGFTGEGEEEYPSDFQDQYIGQCGDNGDYYYGDDEQQNATPSQLVINKDLPPNEGFLDPCDAQNDSKELYGCVDEKENEINSPQKEDFNTEYNPQDFLYEEQYASDANMHVTEREEFNVIATDTHQQIHMDDATNAYDEQEAVYRTGSIENIEQNENIPEYSDNFPVNAEHEATASETVEEEKAESGKRGGTGEVFSSDATSIDHEHAAKSSISKEISEEVFDRILSTEDALEEDPKESADPLQPNIPPAETDSSESCAESPQGHHSQEITEGKRFQQISKGEMDSIVESDQDDIEEQLAALVLEPAPSIPGSSVPHMQTDAGRDEVSKTRDDTIKDSENVSKFTTAPQSGLEVTNVASKKNPSLIKVLESDSESLNISESVTESNEFDFSTE